MVTKNKSQKLAKILLGLGAGLFLLFPYSGIAQLSNSNANTNLNSNTSVSNQNTSLSTEQLNQSIQEKQEQKRLIEQRQQQYQSIISEKQKATASLTNELALLDAQIQKTQLDFEALDLTIGQKQLEINSTQLAIGAKEKELDKQRGYLEELVRTINRYDQQDQLEMLITHDSFSEVINDIRSTSNLENQVTGTLTSIKSAKSNLEREKTERERQKLELVNLQQELSNTEISLNDQKDYKGNLLTETKSNEQLYSNLLEQSKQEQLNADADIKNLQTKLDKKLGNTNSNNDEQNSIFTGNRNAQLSWPISPLKGISAYFHDTTYPFKKYFEHSAIDIPTPQGTAIAAADDGYVALTKNGGFGYSYIALCHTNCGSGGDSLWTVYGHVSQINVTEGTFVSKGQIIGKSGGLPGTPGSGRFTTGAHLHFEVRLNGIPVNPLDYLP